jgi:ATP-dependent Clp protease ATP-binding subunit ClpA
MGETGCGKTALIKKLNQLLNNGEEKLEILNINPSYTDKILIERMMKINEKAKITQNKIKNYGNFLMN